MQEKKTTMSGFDEFIRNTTVGTEESLHSSSIRDSFVSSYRQMANLSNQQLIQQIQAERYQRKHSQSPSTVSTYHEQSSKIHLWTKLKNLFV